MRVTKAIDRYARIQAGEIKRLRRVGEEHLALTGGGLASVPYVRACRQVHRCCQGRTPQPSVLTEEFDRASWVVAEFALHPGGGGLVPPSSRREVVGSVPSERVRQTGRDPATVPASGSTGRALRSRHRNSKSWLLAKSAQLGPVEGLPVAAVLTGRQSIHVTAATFPATAPGSRRPRGSSQERTPAAASSSSLPVSSSCFPVDPCNQNGAARYRNGS